MTEPSYTAWDDKQYVWPPPDGWYEASDGKWWPEGYGPPPSAAADDPVAGTNGHPAADSDSTADSGPDFGVDTDLEPTDSAGLHADTASGAGSHIDDRAVADAGDDFGTQGDDGPGSGTDVVADAASVFDAAADPSAAPARTAVDGPGLTSGFVPEGNDWSQGATGGGFDSAAPGSAAGTETDAHTDPDPDTGRDADPGFGSTLGAAAGGATEAIDGDIADLAAETNSMAADGSGAFSSVPMEMNDLSSASRSDLFDGGAGFSDAPMGAASDLSDAPDINDVMPTEEISSDSLPYRDSPQFDPPADLDTGSQQAGDGGAAGSEDLPAPDAADAFAAGLGTTGSTAPDPGADEFADPLAGDPANGAPDPDSGFAGTELGAGFAGTELGDTDFAGTELAGTELGGTDFAGTDLGGTDFAGTDFAGTEPDFADFPAPAADSDSEFGPGHGPDAGTPDGGATQVVPTELPPAPVDFVPPPPGELPDFAAPPSAQPLSPLDRPTGAPDSPYPGGPDGVGAPPGLAAPTGFGGPPPAGTPPDLNAPGQFPALGQPQGEFAPPPGQQQFGGPMANRAPGFGGSPASDVGPDAQAMLASKAGGGRFKVLLLTVLGVLALVAIGAVLFLVFGGGDDTASDSGDGGSGPGSFSQPHPRSTGVVVFYPDGDTDQRWVVEVLEPVRDATTEIAGDGAVAGPEAGEVFAATRIRVRNESGLDGASLGDLHFNAVTAAGQVIDRASNQCSISVDDLDFGASVGIGTDVQGAVCWSIPAADIDGLKLGIESDKVSGRVHIALQ